MSKARGCLVNWRMVCRPKSLGGLGVMDLERFSRALRIRWMCYEWKDRKRPWVGTSVPCDYTDSSLFDACTSITIGKGDIAKFWTSTWLDGEVPAKIAPHLFLLTRLKNLTVEQAMREGRWMKGLHRITSEIQLREFTTLWIKLQGINLGTDEDQIAWTLNSKAEYSSASTYAVQFAGSFTPINFSKLWRSKVQPKCKFFLWLWLRQRILTDDQLQIRGIEHREHCSLCDQEP